MLLVNKKAIAIAKQNIESVPVITEDIDRFHTLLAPILLNSVKTESSNPINKAAIFNIKNSEQKSGRKFIVNEFDDGLFRGYDIELANSDYKYSRRIYMDIRSFPLYKTKDGSPSFNLYSYRLLDSILNFLPTNIPSIKSKVSFLRDTVLKELIDNVVQSRFAIKKRLDEEAGDNYSLETYDKLFGNGVLSGIFEINYSLTEDANYRNHTIVVKNYDRMVEHHIKRINKRINAKADNISEVMFDLNYENMCEESCTGDAGNALFMAKKGVKNDLAGDFSFRFSPMNFFFPENYFGSYDFVIRIPEPKSLH